MDNNNTVKVELSSDQLAEFVGIVKDLANAVGMHGDLIEHLRKVVEGHDGALVKDSKRLDELEADTFGLALAKRLDGHDGELEWNRQGAKADSERLVNHEERLRKLEWGGDKAPAPDAVKALAKRVDVLDQTVTKTMIALSDRLRVVEHPEGDGYPAELHPMDADWMPPAEPVKDVRLDRDRLAHECFVSQLAIALGRLEAGKDVMPSGQCPEDFIAGARWLLAVARNARP